MSSGEAGTREGATRPAAQIGTGEATATPDRHRTAALRRRLAARLLFELVLPLGSYYGLRAAGAGQWLSMVVGGLLLPWIGYGIVRQRVEAMAVFTLSPAVAGPARFEAVGRTRWPAGPRRPRRACPAAGGIGARAVGTAAGRRATADVRAAARPYYG